MNSQIASAPVSLQFYQGPSYPQRINKAVDHVRRTRLPVWSNNWMDFGMTSASSRAVFLFVVKKAESFLLGLVRLVTTFLGDLCLAVVRVIVTCVVFTTCMMVVLHYMGVPVPGPAELLDKFTDLDRLTSILS